MREGERGRESRSNQLTGGADKGERVWEWKRGDRDPK